MELLRPRTIRARLRRILIVSVALVLALLTIIVTREVQNYRDTGDTARAVQLALAVQDLVHEIQRERGLTNGLLGGDTASRPAVGNQRLATDGALSALNSTLAGQPPGADLVRTALNQFSGVTANRADVDGGRADRSASFTFYTNAIGALNQARPGLDHAQDEQLWRGLQTLYALGDVKEFTGQERGFLNGVFAAGAFAPGEYVKFLDIRAAKQAAVTAFERDATPAQRSLLYTAMRTDESVRAGEAEAIAIASDHGTLTEPVNAADWWRQMTSIIDGERQVQRSVGDEITSRANELRRHAALRLSLYALAALLAIAAEVALVVASVRAIVRPLAKLAEQADEVADERLPRLIAGWQSSEGADPDPPEPVRADHRAGTEIVSVATALDRVQTTAYELASAQARLRRNTTESMANLARRNQNLVRRQLGLISDFEREELDPSALSNLFELDHLATRMRRNAESLLVLVGESSPRRWSRPIPLTDVIRAGLSEVDDYRRVVLRRVDEVAIAGAHVSEVAHMLAELIENGLSFSPPDLEVEIYGRRLGSRYMIAVVDHGVGMPPDQLATANARLRGEADFLVAPTRFLGHYVVGRLARRLGVEVELTVSPTSGVVARMQLPAELLGDPASERPAPPEDAKHAAAAQLPTALETMPEPRAGRHSSPPAPAPGGGERPQHAAVSATDPVFDTGTAAFVALTEAFDASAAPEPRPGTGPSGTLPRINGTSRPNGGVDAGSAHANPLELVPLPDPTGTASPGPVDTALHSATAPHATAAERLFGGPTTGSFAIQSIPGQSPVSGQRPASAPSGTGVAPSGTGVAPSVSVGSPVGGTGVSGGVPEVQRTRNGLVKRNRKTREHSGAAPGGAQPSTGGPAASAADRSPDEIRSMLAGFRSGHQRGQSGEPPRPGPRA
ncbi:nitrate- and nitrite sensing domain-containing protein [Nocardia sp. CDC153]|uniref:sensor histidine kinase n=1 Tax=Nocardia sp. CDC153 TaxID=3112167 RepID=UPI002DB7D9CA|nr:nitrate- and nitrite sensing domain-containing protein [Nocardia sp. CDC153]MEC3957082.1 nitrate- and nitrite sensing domain-containing protein [Nocardia sp. CDC153]